MQGLTCDVVRQLERRYAVLDVYIKDIVVFLALVKLLSTGADGIDNITDLLPARSCTIPLNVVPQ